MIERIVGATLLVEDVDAAVEAYEEFLHYSCIGRANITQDEASVWGSRNMVDADCALLRPESGADFVLRMIQAEPTKGYAALKTYGWNAVELLVQDPDQLRHDLNNSPFEILGDPYNLTSDGSARAMQVRGPSGEILYLTRLSGDYAEFFGNAKSRVDRAFVIVCGGPSLEELMEFYHDRLGRQLISPTVFEITVLSRALGLPLDTSYPLSSARFDKDFSIELDQYPPETSDRPRRDGELPPGISMISMSVRNLDQIPLQWRATPLRLSGAPYEGRCAAVAVGRAGEWIEFIEKGTE